MSGWYYKRDDGEIVGILSEDEIKRCAERGGISLRSPIMHEEKTNGEWVPAKRIKPLRKRIEANEQQRQATAAPVNPPAMAGYVPPSPTKSSQSQLKTIWRNIRRAAVAVIQATMSVVDYLTAKKPLHVCEKCEAEFAKYAVPGQCPLCGEWAIVGCESCGLESGAKRFVENGFKCPRCGDKVAV